MINKIVRLNTTSEVYRILDSIILTELGKTQTRYLVIGIESLIITIINPLNIVDILHQDSTGELSSISDLIAKNGL